MTAPACELCRYFMLEEDCLPGTHKSPGIGDVCTECREHTTLAYTALSITPGIAAHPLPAHRRRNARKVGTARRAVRRNPHP